MQNTSYIELIGLPGAGKTETANLLLRCFGESNKRAVKRERLTLNFLLKTKLFFFTAILPLTNIRLLKLIFSGASPAYHDTAHIYSTLFNLRHGLVKEIVLARELFSRTEEVFINDEGVAGKLVALSILSNCNKEGVKDLITELLPQSTGIIYLKVDTEIAIQRENERNITLPFFDDMPEEKKRKFFNESAKIHATLTSRVVENNGTKESLHEAIKNILC